jgi:hypothetical protein
LKRVVLLLSFLIPVSKPPHGEFKELHPYSMTISENNNSNEYLPQPVELSKQYPQVMDAPPQRKAPQLPYNRSFQDKYSKPDAELIPLHLTDSSSVYLRESSEDEINETDLDSVVLQHTSRNTVVFLEPEEGPVAKTETMPSSLQRKAVTPAPRRKSYNWLPKRISVRHIQGNQNEVAYGTNYSTLALLYAPPYRLGRFIPLFDFRGHRFDDNTYAANFGLISRYIPFNNTFCEILGFNAYYDYRQGGIGYYQQVGCGVEILGRRWDFRGNLYVPFGAKTGTKICVYDDYEGDYVITNNLWEDVSYTFSAEVGYMMLRSKYLLFYLAAGPYYIAGRDCYLNTVGGKARIRPQYKDYIALDLSISHDPLFETIWQAEVIVYFPLYQIGNQRKSRCLSDRQVYQPVERFEVMPLMRESCWKTNF